MSQPNRNWCYSCPVLDYTTCRLMDMVVNRLKWRGMTNCEIRTQTEIIIAEIRRHKNKGYAPKTGDGE